MELQKQKSESKVIPSSYKLFGSNKWMPRVLLIEERTNKQVPFFWNMEFETKEEADQYALQKLKEQFTK